MDNYSDIINLEHHVSSVHKQMSIEDRSAQFAPFAALTGYSDEVKEKARRTTTKIILDDDEKYKINDIIQDVVDSIEKKPLVAITYFVKDKKKDGGKYITIKDNVKRVELVYRVIYLNKTNINIDDIIDIEVIK